MFNYIYFCNIILPPVVVWLTAKLILMNGQTVYKISCFACLVSCLMLALVLPCLLLWSLSCRALIRCQSGVVHFFYIFETYHSVCSDWIIILVMYFEMYFTCYLEIFIYLLMRCLILFRCDVFEKNQYACFGLIEEVASRSFI